MTDRLLSNWITAYMTYTAQSRSPDAFHLWVAMTTIAGAVRRKAFFNFDYFLLYPNLYVVLVSPAGKCKKSTAMRIGRGMLSQVPGINFSTDSTSRERLILDLTQSHSPDGHSSMTAYSSEFASLLATSAMDMVIFMTDIYDSPDEWSHKTKSGGTNKIKAPYLNLIGGTTPDWMAKALPLDTIGIGLTARILFIYQETPRVRRAFPELTKDQLELKNLLIADLTQISLISGQYIMEPDAKQFYEDWELKFQEERTLTDPRIVGYYERKSMHVIKVAMVIAASQRDETTLVKQDIVDALALLADVEPLMAKAFSAVGKNPLTLDIDQVVMAVLTKPGIEFAELMTAFKHSLRKEELEEVISTLMSMKLINVVQDKTGPKYYPTS